MAFDGNCNEIASPKYGQRNSCGKLFCIQRFTRNRCGEETRKKLSERRRLIAFEILYFDKLIKMKLTRKKLGDGRAEF